MITVKIPKDRDGRPKQFAFVNFKHEESVPYGLRLLNGIKLYGRPMRIQFRSGTGGTLNNPFSRGKVKCCQLPPACNRITVNRVNCRSLSPRGPSSAISAPLTHSCPGASTRDLLSLMAGVTLSAEPSLWVFIGYSCSTSKICSKLSHEH